MTPTYDPTANGAYIQLREPSGDVATIRIAEDFLIDIGEDGKVCGIELLNANDQFNGDNGRFVLINPLSGEEHELKVG